MQEHYSTVVELLCHRGRSQSRKMAYSFLQDGEKLTSTLSYQQLDGKAGAIASRLQSLGLTGERALLLYPPGLEFIAAFFGCLYAGVIAVPAYPPRRNQKLSRLQAIASDASAKIILTTASLKDDIERRFAEDARLEGIQCLSSDNLDGDRASEWEEREIDPHSLAFLQYTSGSTGTPKGVMVTHRNLMHNEKAIAQSFGHHDKTIVVGWLPTFHDMGLIGNVLQPLYLGIPSILLSPVAFLQQPICWLKAISQYKATTSGGPNFAYDLCVRKVKPEQLSELDLSSWDLAFNGAEPIRSETLEQFATKFQPCGFRKEAFYPCYGMAETTLFITGGYKPNLPIISSLEGTALAENQITVSTNTVKDARQIVGCGRTWLDDKIAIVDPETCEQCPGNRVGEIWVSGASIAQGYWNRQTETERTFNAYIKETGEGPFLRTGDLGFLLDGELFVTGRIKDVIIIRGRNHYPQDIEGTVEQSHPALRPGCGAAFVLELKGAERLIVVQEVERSYLRKLKIDEVVGNIRQAVASGHELQVYAVALIKPGSIPKTSSGKIQRHACQASFVAGSLDVIEELKNVGSAR